MKKILVINNDFDTMTLLKSWLEKKSYIVKFTGKQQDVPVLMKEFAPELVIVDVLQNEVVDQLKTEETYRSVPLLLMTGYTLKRGISKANGHDDTIEKPFNLHLLEKKIEKLIHRRNTEKIV